MTISPMSLGDLFDRWFRLIGKTWLRNLILSVVILGPATLVLAICLDIGFSQIAELIDQGSDFESGDFTSLFAFFGWLFIGLLLLLLGTVAATIAVTMVGCAEMDGKPLSWQDALQSAFGMSFVKVLAQYILLGLGVAVIMGVPYGLIIGGIAAESAGLGLAGGLLIFATIPVVIYFAINFAFIVPATAWESETVFGAFQRSWNLVRGNWWRTFGILILMGLIVSFAISIVMTPLYIIVLWDFFQSYFEMLGSIGSGEPDPAFAKQMLTSFGFAFGVINAISTIAQMIVTPLYTVAMYFDLRARKGEFSQPATPAPAPIR